MSQSQKSTIEQLWATHQLATEAGLYDAADWLRARLVPPARHPNEAVEAAGRRAYRALGRKEREEQSSPRTDRPSPQPERESRTS